jgi:hypothetical protein
MGSLHRYALPPPPLRTASSTPSHPINTQRLGMRVGRTWAFNERLPQLPGDYDEVREVVKAKTAHWVSCRLHRLKMMTLRTPCRSFFLTHRLTTSGAVPWPRLRHLCSRQVGSRGGWAARVCVCVCLRAATCAACTKHKHTRTHAHTTVLSKVCFARMRFCAGNSLAGPLRSDHGRFYDAKVWGLLSRH